MQSKGSSNTVIRNCVARFSVMVSISTSSAEVSLDPTPKGIVTSLRLAEVVRSRCFGVWFPRFNRVFWKRKGILVYSVRYLQELRQLCLEGSILATRQQG
ncbi:hypothetical protein AVEN_47233-1 [Araneus ventricosus]|uniref:Uncharacterized protein n=1 Tax=Araneus ventricosus TaxID=182803 RepID=A0A4Y2HG33_ARAVE|nr:hypothetical protein AVEN_47233-1 [Araneus ventricosus]